jgi:hypothetical protein
VYNFSSKSKKSIYAYEALKLKNDKHLWNGVFQKHNSLFLYYLHLTTDYLSILPKQNRITYTPTQTSNTYNQITFQEFVDDKVNMQKIGYREYQNFIKSMKDYNFKKNLIEKYRNDTEIITLKNYVIYVIQLRLSKEINLSEYFTEEEVSDMDISIQPIPFFEYLYRNSNESEDKTLSVNAENFISLENSIIKLIQDNV